MKQAVRITVIVVCALAVVVLFAASRTAQAQTGGQNLLVDGDFEAPPTWPQQDGIGEVQVAPGWRAYYLDNPPGYVQIPANCNDSKEHTRCYWMRPEFRDNTSFENRIHSGARSQKYFSYGRMHEAGLYQQVGGIKPGSQLHFSIYVQAWQCFNIDLCGKNGIRSDDPTEMHLRVGIDPTGGTDPFSPNIVWSPEQAAFDRWVEFSVEAVAKNDTVTVFTHSRPEWAWARLNNDVYLDDASLVVVSGTTVPIQPVVSNVPVTLTKNQLLREKQLLRELKKLGLLDRGVECDTPACSAAPVASTSVTPAASTSVIPTAATPMTSTVSASTTPAPSGAPRTYVVSEGDTLSLIAKRFSTTIEAFVQANGLTNIDFIWTGQTLILP